MPDENDIRKTIVTVCRLLDRRGLISGPGGNVSARSGEGGILITPSGYLLAEMSEDVLVEVSMAGEFGGSDDNANAPSSEYRIHLGLYERFPEARAVIHAHPPTVVGLAAGDVDFNLGLAADVPYYGDRVAVVDSDPGGDITDDILTAGTPIVVVRKHGTLIAGSCLSEAFHLTEMLEACAKTIFVARFADVKHVIAPDKIDAYCAERPATVYRNDRLRDMLD